MTNWGPTRMVTDVHCLHCRHRRLLQSRAFPLRENADTLLRASHNMARRVCELWHSNFREPVTSHNGEAANVSKSNPIPKKKEITLTRIVDFESEEISLYNLKSIAQLTHSGPLGRRHLGVAFLKGTPQHCFPAEEGTLDCRGAPSSREGLIYSSLAPYRYPVTPPGSWLGF
ncbi:hypothetical protein VTK56DRAFT_1114 [Thermocarpiscus australiensis]